MLIKVQYTKVEAGWKETTWCRAVLWASASREVLEPPGLSGQGREGLLEHGDSCLAGAGASPWPPAGESRGMRTLPHPSLVLCPLDSIPIG